MFPSTISTFNIVSASDRLNSPSHSALHNSVSSVLTQVQTVIGVEGANSVVGSLNYLIKSPASDGGGHIQTANKGGTGITSYSKGDLLVATSSSVISKLVVGVDGQTIISDSSVASGIKWGIPPGIKLGTRAITSTLSNVLSGSIFSVNVPASTVGTTNAIRAKAYITQFTGDSASASVLLSAVYGNTQVGSILYNQGTGASMIGFLECTLVGNNADNSQQGTLVLNIQKNTGGFVTALGSQPSVIYALSSGSSSEDSGKIQPFGFTARFSNTGPDIAIVTRTAVAEKIT